MAEHERDIAHDDEPAMPFAMSLARSAAAARSS
jgi:hypothetical protein